MNEGIDISSGLKISSRTVKSQGYWSNLFDLLTVQCRCTRWSLIDNERPRIRYVCTFRVCTNVWTEHASNLSLSMLREEERREKKKECVSCLSLGSSFSLARLLGRTLSSHRDEKFLFLFFFVLKAESFEHRLNANRWQTTFCDWIRNGWRVQACVYRRFLSYSNYILDYKYKHSSFSLLDFIVSVIVEERKEDWRNRGRNFIELKNSSIFFSQSYITDTFHLYAFLNIAEKGTKSKRLPESIIIIIIAPVDVRRVCMSKKFNDVIIPNSSPFFLFSFLHGEEEDEERIFNDN